MNKELPKIFTKQFVKKSLDEISKKFLENQGLVLTTGTIVCNTAALALTYKNAEKIHSIISDTKDAIAIANEQHKDTFDIYKQACIELAKAGGPVIIFELISIICTIQLERKNMKNEAKIAELTAMITLAQNTISEYSSFKEETRKEVGEEKYRQIQNEVVNQKIQGDATPSNIHVNVGENLCYFPYLDKWFSGTASDLEAGMTEINDVLERNQDGYGRESSRGNEIVLIEDICNRFKIDDRSQVSSLMGFESQRTKYIEYWVGTGHINDTLYFTLNIETEPYSV